MNELGDAAVDEGSQRVTWRNRMVSMACIGLVWLMVRLVAELNGTGWERAFWNMAIFLGAYPSMFSLVLAAFSQNRSDQTWHRRSSFWIIPLSLIFSLLFGGDKPLSGQGATLNDYMLLLGFQVFIILASQPKLYSKLHKGEST